MSDWADDRLKRLRDQQENKRIQQEAFIETQKLKRAEGLPLWLCVRETIQKHCTDFNAKARRELLTFEVTLDTELSVRAAIQDAPGRLYATFEESTGKLSWQCGKSSGNWRIIPDGNGGVCFQGVRGCEESKDIAADMLDALVLGERWP